MLGRPFLGAKSQVMLFEFFLGYLKFQYVKFSVSWWGVSGYGVDRFMQAGKYKEVLRHNKTYNTCGKKHTHRCCRSLNEFTGNLVSIS